MAGQTLSTFDAVLKNVYRGAIVEQLNQETYAIDQFEKTNVNDLGTFTGRNLIFAVHTGRNVGRGATTDGGALQSAGSQSYQDATVSIKYFDAAIELTDMVIRQATGGNEGAFTAALSSEMDRGTTDLRRTINRMVYGTGDGLLATCNSSVNSTIITVDSGQYIAVGDVVDVLTKTNGTSKATAVAVTAVSFTGTAASSTQANASITLASAANVTSADGVYLTGDRSNESDGLRNITDSSRTLHNINSSTVKIWNGNQVDAANTNGSEDLFIQLSQVIKQRSNTQIDSYLTTLGVQRRLAAQYASQKRWNDANVTQIDGGYSAIMVAAGNKPVPVIADTECPNGFAFALNKASFAWSELAKPDWLSPPEGGGGILHLKDGSTAGSKVAAWQAWMIWYATLVNVAPNRNGRIVNLNDDKPIARDQ